MKRFYLLFKTYYKLITAFFIICSLHLILGYNVYSDATKQGEQLRLKRIFYKAESQFSEVFMSKCSSFLNPKSSYRVLINDYFTKNDIKSVVSSKKIIEIDNLSFHLVAFNLSDINDPRIKIAENGFYVSIISSGKCFGVI